MALTTKIKRPAHIKKLQAEHHRRSSKHYIKAYWPYLPIAAIVLGGFLINQHLARPAVLGASADTSSLSLLQDTNSARHYYGQRQLQLNGQLRAAAQAKADDMARQGYWAHTSPDGKTPWDFITASGYGYQAAGENLAYGFHSADEVTTAWLHSPEHRANLLSTLYSQVGFGVAQSPNYQGHGPQTIIVAEYGQPAAGTPNPELSAASANVAVTELPAKHVARLQLINGDQATWRLAVVWACSGFALAVILMRHGFRIKRVLSEGEAFVAHHPYVDIIMTLVVVIGFLVTRSSGFIR